MINLFKRKSPRKLKYKVSHDPYGGGYVVHTDERHVEYFNNEQEAYILRNKLNEALNEKI